MGDNVKVRELTREEIAKIPDVQTPLPPNMWAMGVENDAGEIVASLPIYLALRADPLWIREDYRKHPRVLLRLWQETRRKLSEGGDGELLVGFTPGYPGPPLNDVLLKIYAFVGGREIQARFFIIPLDQRSDV